MHWVHSCLAFHVLSLLTNVRQMLEVRQFITMWRFRVCKISCSTSQFHSGCIISDFSYAEKILTLASTVSAARIDQKKCAKQGMNLETVWSWKWLNSLHRNTKFWGIVAWRPKSVTFYKMNTVFFPESSLVVWKLCGFWRKGITRENYRLAQVLIVPSLRGFGQGFFFLNFFIFFLANGTNETSSHSTRGSGL